jgi:hypothetical protein
VVRRRRACGTISVVVRWLRLPLVLLLGLGFTAGAAEAQLWKPNKKKPAATKAKSAPPASRKVSKPTKRKPKATARRKPAKARPAADDAPQVTTGGDADFDDAPIITILPGDEDE